MIINIEYTSENCHYLEKVVPVYEYMNTLINLGTSHIRREVNQETLPTNMDVIRIIFVTFILLQCFNLTPMEVAQYFNLQITFMVAYIGEK